MRAENYFKLAESMFTAAIDEIKGSPPRATAARYFRQSCKGLNHLSKDLSEPDGDLYWSMKHLDQLSQKSSQEYSDRIGSIQTMFDTFMVAEKNLFKKYKVPKAVQEFILSQANELEEKFDGYDKLTEESRLQIAQNVTALKTEVCRYSSRLESIEHSALLLKRTAYLSAGAGVVILNASADAITTFGLAPWMTTLSGELGGLIMSNAESQIPFA